MSVSIPKQSTQSMQIPSRIKNPTTGQYIPLSSTPGGSLYGTTPGGTRIQYDRSSLLNYRNSPLSKSPAHIPQAIINLGVTTESAQPIPEKLKSVPESSTSPTAQSTGGKKDDHDDELFEME